MAITSGLGPFKNSVEYAIAIEILCTNWATLEWTLAVGIKACLRMPDRLSSDFTDSLDLEKRAAMLARLSELRFPVEDQALMKRIHTEVKELVPERNLVIHGRRHFTRDGEIYYAIDRGRYRNQKTKRTTKEISALSTKIADLGIQLSDCLFKHKLLESGADELAEMFDEQSATSK